MSETDNTEPQQPISMTKGAPAKNARPSAGRPPVANLPLPWSIKGVYAALALVIVGLIARAVLVHSASTSSLTSILKYANAHLKKPKKHYGAVGDTQILKDLHTLRSAYIPLAILTSLVIVILMFSLRRARSASGSRWVLILAMFFPSPILLGFVSPHGFPAGARFAGILISIGAIAAVGLVFAPPSTAYARACKLAATPEGMRGQPRPSLFGPRRPVGQPAGTRPGTRPAQTRPVASAGSSGKARAKVRNDSEAVARGAELARSRAKAASKSRRTDR